MCVQWCVQSSFYLNLLQLLLLVMAPTSQWMLSTQHPTPTPCQTGGARSTCTCARCSRATSRQDGRGWLSPQPRATPLQTSTTRWLTTPKHRPCLLSSMTFRHIPSTSSLFIEERQRELIAWTCAFLLLAPDHFSARKPKEFYMFKLLTGLHAWFALFLYFSWCFSFMFEDIWMSEMREEMSEFFR